MSPTLTWAYSWVFPRRFATQGRRLLFHYPLSCCLTTRSSPSAFTIIFDLFSSLCFFFSKSKSNYPNHLSLKRKCIFLNKRNCNTALRYISNEQVPLECFLDHQPCSKAPSLSAINDPQLSLAQDKASSM